MSITNWLILTALIALLCGSSTGADQPTAISVKDNTGVEFHRNTNPDAQWYPKAGFGLFIHWGIASLTGKSELSWGMIKNDAWDPEGKKTITPRQYCALADRFNPDKYDPDKWLKAAKAAGCQYVVLTSKHHDGYALWPSAYGQLSTRTHMGGRDLLKPYVDACRKNGLKVGFYYSPPDWFFNRRYTNFGNGKGTPESPAVGFDHEPVVIPPKPEGFEQRYREYVRGQVEELLTRYGKIDVLWFDGSCQGAISVERVRQLQPGIVINDRQHGIGDFITSSYEAVMPQSRPSGWWEHCETAVAYWGYTDNGDFCQPIGYINTILSMCRSWGGNYLMNFAPGPDGQMPEKYYRSMSQLAAWMKHSGKSVIGAQPGPYPEQCNVPVTINGKAWYLHATPGLKDATIVVTGIKKPASVKLMRTGEKLQFAFKDGKMTLNIPDALRTEMVDVVEMTWR